jgi:putative adhesin
MDTIRGRFAVSAGLLAAAVTAVAGCGSGGAGQPAPATSVRLSTGGRIVIDTDNGVRLRPAAGVAVTVEDGPTLQWSNGGPTTTLDLACSSGRGDALPCPRMPVVRIPATTAVTVVARNAGIDVSGMTGDLDLTTVNGDVTADRSGRADATVRLVTRNGSVRTTALRAGHLRAETVNGDIVLGCDSAPSQVSAVTVNGSARLAVPRGAAPYRVEAATANGLTDVTVPTEGPADGRSISLSTVNGDVSAHDDR